MDQGETEGRAPIQSGEERTPATEEEVCGRVRALKDELREIKERYRQISQYRCRQLQAQPQGSKAQSTAQLLHSDVAKGDPNRVATATNPSHLGTRYKGDLHPTDGTEDTQRRALPHKEEQRTVTPTYPYST